MTGTSPPEIRALATGFGLVMVTAPAVGSGFTALTALAVGAVAAGVFLRPAATAAVLLTVVAIAVGAPAAMLAAVSGCAAAAYLALRHTVGGAATVTAPTAVAAGGFTVVGVVSTAFPFALPWVPLAAPFAVLGIYALAIGPFLGGRR